MTSFIPSRFNLRANFASNPVTVSEIIKEHTRHNYYSFATKIRESRKLFQIYLYATEQA